MPSTFVPTNGPRLLGSSTGPGGIQRYDLTDVPGTPPDETPVNQTVVVTGVVTHAVLLTHDCEIDKDNTYRTVALVRPFSTLPGEAVDGIRRGKRYRFFYLAPQQMAPAIIESYLDLRRVTTVRADWLARAERVASMTSLVRDALRGALVRYWSRVEEEP